MGAIAVDLSIVSTRGQSLQNAADSAALAGVQAMRASLDDAGAGDQAAAQAAAEAAVAELLAQNGIDVSDGTSFDVEFTDSENNTEVKVTLTDGDPGTMLTGVTGVTSEVERTATAKFEACQAACTVNVVIPSPFRDVSATGEGDGFQPIAVDNRFYALNHNSSYGGIVCIDRNAVEDDNPSNDDEYKCWPGSTTRPAYPGGAHTVRNPEMPHTAVIGSRIYWTAADWNSTKLWCFETATNVPCASTTINNRGRSTNGTLNNKDRDRGGGTIAVDGRIFAFTDDHRVHCFVPGAVVLPCSGYESNGKASYIGADLNFPENDPNIDGNHGSSIDRVVDEETGRIYWTIHISSAATGPADCSSDNQEFPSGLVSIQNAWSGLFITRNGTDISNSPTNDDADTHWTVVPRGSDKYAFRSASSASTRVIDADWGTADLDISTSINIDDEWIINYQVTTSTIENGRFGTYMGDDGASFITDPDFLPGTQSDWIIRHPFCFDPAYTPGAGPSPLYAVGTWVQCWDTINNESCSNFEPQAPIHTDGSRFSGRLFLYMNNAGNPTADGICSTGFDQWVADENFELTCLDKNTAAVDTARTATMSTLAARIAEVTDDSPAAWGVPHYNENANRLFYPSAHDISRVLCWDFDSASYCDRVQGFSGTTRIEDYGFYSEGDCVYGLGHNAVFWAFQADDIFSECTGSTTRTTIEPCDCSGEWKWGTITFDVELALFDEFYVQVENSDGDLVYPVPANPDDELDPYYRGHSLHDHGIIVDLNSLPVSGDPDSDFLEILVFVASDSDPWAAGEQTFSIEFARAPRLVD